MSTLVKNQSQSLARKTSRPARGSQTALAKMDPREISGWNDLVLASSDYSVFHTANWAQVLIDTYGCTPSYLARIANGRFAFLLPVMNLKSPIAKGKAMSLPFSDYCRPIGRNPDAMNLTLPQIIAHAKDVNWKSVQFRGARLTGDGVMPSDRYVQHILQLTTGEEDLFSKLRGNYRSKIRKAIKKDIQIQMGADRESLDLYYHLHCITRKRQGLPPQPAKFFEAIFENIIAKDMGSVVLAYHNDHPVAGSVYFHFGEKVIYKFGALDVHYQKFNPSYLVMWHAIKTYGAKGYRELCFGRTDAHHEGLVQYKDGWGCEREDLNYYLYDVGSGGFTAAKAGSPKKLGYAAFAKMPMGLLKLCGRLLYPHFG